MSKKYNITVSTVFPATHPRKGEPTYFQQKMEHTLGLDEFVVAYPFKKLHTLRANFELWKKRIDEVNAGRAVLQVCRWEGKPYRSKLTVLFVFDNDSEIGVQKALFVESLQTVAVGNVQENRVKSIAYSDIAMNDGLMLDDFIAWFKKYDLSKPMAIIHFKKFRY